MREYPRGSYLHNHTHYSNLRLIDAISKPDTLIRRAHELGAKGVAITEHECLSSHVKAYKAYKKLCEEQNIKEKDFKLILGNELYLVDDVLEMKNHFDREKHGYWHFIVLSKNKAGYRLLKRMSSTAWHQSYFQRRFERTPLEKSQLARIIGEEKGNLIASTACLGGELPQLLLKKANTNPNDHNMHTYYNQRIDNFINMGIELFGRDDFYLEIQPSNNEEQKIVNRYMKILSEMYGIKIIITTDTHYLNKEDRYVHKAYLNSKDGEREVDAFYQTTYLMPFDEIYEYLKDDYTYEEYLEILDNTNAIADKCDVYDNFHKQVIPEWDVEKDLKRILQKYENRLDTSNYPSLDSMVNSKNIQNRYYFWKCYEGLNEKVLSKEEKKKRLNEYLDKWEIEAKTLIDISPVIEEDMTKYYNTMKFIMDLVWEQGDSIVGPGRGSANGFLSCYLMDITQDDPVIYDLPEWRHISATRPELPELYIGQYKERELFHLIGVLITI